MNFQICDKYFLRFFSILIFIQALNTRYKVMLFKLLQHIKKFIQTSKKKKKKNPEDVKGLLPKVSFRQNNFRELFKR